MHAKLKSHHRSFRSAFCRGLLLFTALIAIANTARAQPIGEYYESIEWMVADSSLVVRGKIAALKVTSEPDDPGDWYHVTMRVDETLKGEHQQTRQFAVYESKRDKELRRWKDEDSPFLACLTENRRLVPQDRRYARFPYAPRTGYGRGSLVELVPKAKPFTYGTNLLRLEEPGELLKAARDAVALGPDSGKVYGACLVHPDSAFLHVTVPVNARLEKIAGDWVQSKDKGYRRVGAKVLIYFRSDENVQRLQELLRDEGGWDHVRQQGGKIVSQTRVYEVRQEAYEILTAWGYSFPKPVLWIPIPIDEPDD